MKGTEHVGYDGGYASRTTFMHGLKFALVAAAVVALVAVIPALLGPSRAEALASVTDADPVPARPREAGRAAN